MKRTNEQTLGKKAYIAFHGSPGLGRDYDCLPTALKEYWQRTAEELFREGYEATGATFGGFKKEEEG